MSRLVERLWCGERFGGRQFNVSFSSVSFSRSG